MQLVYRQHASAKGKSFFSRDKPNISFGVHICMSTFPHQLLPCLRILGSWGAGLLERGIDEMEALWKLWICLQLSSPFVRSCVNLRSQLGSKRRLIIRGSPIGFSGYGISLISRPGFGILKKRGYEIRDCNYHRDTRFGDFNKRESGNVALKKPRFGNSRDWKMQNKSSCHLSSSY